MTATVDERLNEYGYIVPGLGDAGDRQFGAMWQGSRPRAEPTRRATARVSTSPGEWLHERVRADRRRVALRERPPAHRPRVRLRCALRRVLPLPADGRQPGPHGLRDRRARHPDPGPGRRRGHHPPRAGRPLLARDPGRPGRASGCPTTCSPAPPPTTTTAWCRSCSPRCGATATSLPETTLGAISPSTGRTLPDRYIEGICPICNYPHARGDQCDNCGNQLDPSDLGEPRSRINGETPEFRETEQLMLDLPAFSQSLHRWLDTRTAWRPNVLNFSRNLHRRPQAAGDQPRHRLGRQDPARRLVRLADEALLRLVRRRRRLPVGVGGVGRAHGRQGRLEAVVVRPGGVGLLLHGQGQHHLPLGDVAGDPARQQRRGGQGREPGRARHAQPPHRGRVLASS